MQRFFLFAAGATQAKIKKADSYIAYYVLIIIRSYHNRIQFS